MGSLLPGQFLYVFSVSIVDAILLSWLALYWYRRTVRRLMLGRASKPAVPASAAAVTHSTDAGQDGSLGFALFEPSKDTATRLEGHEPQVPVQRLVVAYAIGAALYSAVLTTLTLGPEASPLPFVAWVANWWMNAWPLVPTLIALLVLDRHASVRLAGWYLLGGSVTVAAITLARQVFTGSFNSAPLTNVFWMVAGLLWTAWLPLLLLLMTGWRRVRAVTPLALATTLLFGFGFMLFREAFVRGLNLDAVRSFVLDLAVLTSTEIAQYGLFMLLILPVGWLAWRLLRVLARAFDHKRFSDIQLMVDCWWVVVIADQITLTLSITYGVWGIAYGVAAFAAYRVGAALGLRGLSGLPEPRFKRLLLLRVFGYQARTEALFDRIAQRWRFHGPVQLIAGADLAMRTADPGDMLAFLNGRLADRYVASAASIPQRIERLDVERDPDGRYRVNEFYCRDDTWRSTLEALLEASDTVLMDLRSFCGRNAGCIFELEQLVKRVPTDNIILVCDKTTDLPLLGSILTDAWRQARGEGRGSGSGQVALVRMEGHSPRELTVLLRRLLGLGDPQRLFTPADLPAALA